MSAAGTTTPSVDAAKERRRAAIAASYAAQAKARLDAINALIAAAIAAGTHSPTPRRLCGGAGCGKWVTEIWYVVPGTRTELCAECADKMNQGPASVAAKLGRTVHQVRPITPAPPSGVVGKLLEPMQ